MRIFPALGPRRPLDRANAWGCVTSNQLVLPGLGSLVAGRRVGYCQATLALIGLVGSALFATWLVVTWVQLQPKPEDWETWQRLFSAWKPYLILGAAGFGSFIIGWLWALWTSLCILNEARDPKPPITAP